MENFKVSNSWLMFIFGRLSRTLDPKVNYVLWSLGIRACIVSENEITEQWLKSWLLQKQVALGTLLCGLEISYIWKYEHFIHRHWGVSVIFVFLFWKLNMQRGQGLHCITRSGISEGARSEGYIFRQIHLGLAPSLILFDMLATHLARIGPWLTVRQPHRWTKAPLALSCVLK